MATPRLARLRAQYQGALSAIGIPPAGVRPAIPRPPLAGTVAAAWLAWIPWTIVGGVHHEWDWAFLLAPLPIGILLLITGAITLAPVLTQQRALRAGLTLAIIVMAATGWDGGWALGGLFLAIVCGVIPAATAAWAVVLLWRHSVADWLEQQTNRPG